MCSQDEAHLIIFKESLHSIWAEFNDVSCSVRVSHEVRLDSEFTVRISWITPKNVDNKLLLYRGNLVYDFERSSDLLNLLKTDEGTSDTTVKADNSILDDCGKWEPIKELINFIEY